MENKNIFLGKIEGKNGCYLNDGKYGYFLTCDKQNYKLPEYLLPDEVTLDMAKRIIEYKKKMSKQYFVPKEAIPSCGSDDDDGCDGKVPKLKIKV
jgi:topoisomerase IA-like protein